MARFASSGSGIAAPLRSEAELRRVLSELSVADTLDAAAIQEIYLELSIIIGKWFAEQERVEIEPVSKALLTIAKNLNEACQVMSGLETGMRTGFETAVASQILKYLELEPTVGSSSKAQELMASFREQAAQMGQVCMIAHADLFEKTGKHGRVALEWYDDFTALLLEIAARAGVEATNRKDRGSQVRSGWLFDAAMSLETFLYRGMRSPSDEACGKRLDRSGKRLRSRARQKPSAR